MQWDHRKDPVWPSGPRAGERAGPGAEALERGLQRSPPVREKSPGAELSGKTPPLFFKNIKWQKTESRLPDLHLFQAEEEQKNNVRLQELVDKLQSKMKANERHAVTIVFCFLCTLYTLIFRSGGREDIKIIIMVLLPQICVSVFYSLSWFQKLKFFMKSCCNVLCFLIVCRPKKDRTRSSTPHEFNSWMCMKSSLPH